MTTNDSFVDLVRKMRTEQREFYNARKAGASASPKQAIELERLVDARILRGNARDLIDVIRPLVEWLPDQRFEVDQGQGRKSAVYVLDGKRVDRLIDVLKQAIEGANE